MHLCQAILDVYGGSIGEARLFTRFNFVDIQVLWYLIELSSHLLHYCVIFIIRVLLDSLRQALSCFLHLLTVVGGAELHYRRQVFLLLGVEYIC